ncbi:MAG: hypothetical protein AAB567_03175 [Patescibacteria group bacterium]
MFFNTLFTATKTVLTAKRYLLIFFVLFPIAFLVFILIPVLAIPGNDIAFQLSIFTSKDYTLLIVLAPLISLVITMQIFIFRRNKNIKENLKSAGVGAAGSYSGVIGTVFATASCSSCVAVLFGFLGTGAVFFAVENRWLFVSLAIGLMLISLYFAARKINKVCTSC